MNKKKETIEINFPQMLDVLGGAIGRALISSKKEQSKNIFKELKQGKVLDMGALNYGEKLKIDFQLKLDYSEFRGPGFNYDILRAALAMLLNKLGATMKAKQEIKLLGSETGVQLLAIPGVVHAHDQDNVLMMSVEFTNKSSVIVNLMFMDPEQFGQETGEDAPVK